MDGRELLLDQLIELPGCHVLGLFLPFPGFSIEFEAPSTVTILLTTQHICFVNSALDLAYNMHLYRPW
jgi:hypothetical protein